MGRVDLYHLLRTHPWYKSGKRLRLDWRVGPAGSWSGHEAGGDGREVVGRWWRPAFRESAREEGIAKVERLETQRGVHRCVKERMHHHRPVRALLRNPRETAPFLRGRALGWMPSD